jgi:hypothetical protein
MLHKDNPNPIPYNISLSEPKDDEELDKESNESKKSISENANNTEKEEESQLSSDSDSGECIVLDDEDSVRHQKTMAFSMTSADFLISEAEIETQRNLASSSFKIEKNDYEKDIDSSLPKDYNTELSNETIEYNDIHKTQDNPTNPALETETKREKPEKDKQDLKPFKEESESSDISDEESLEEYKSILYYSSINTKNPEDSEDPDEHYKTMDASGETKVLEIPPKEQSVAKPAQNSVNLESTIKNSLTDIVKKESVYRRKKNDNKGGSSCRNCSVF